MAVYRCYECGLMNMDDHNRYKYSECWCNYHRRYYEPDSRACSHAIPRQSGNSGNCYITTAICDILGFEDDCDYLRTLRGFRDNYMMNKSELFPLLEEYDEIGPIISDCLWNDENKESVANNILEFGIKPSYFFIKDGDEESAIKTYVNMVNALKDLYGLHDVKKEEKYPVRKRIE